MHSQPQGKKYIYNDLLTLSCTNNFQVVKDAIFLIYGILCGIAKLRPLYFYQCFPLISLNTPLLL